MNPPDGGVGHAFFLVGPTAAGKSDVAQILAERRGSGILSADAMQVYRGMDVGTAKIPVSARGAVPYWGLDLVEPTETFSAGDFLAHARDVFARAGTSPLIVVGGTGLYVKALVHGLDVPAGGQTPARGLVRKVYAARGVVGLQEELRRLDPKRLDALSDQRNPRRLLRALELVLDGSTAGTAWTRAELCPMVGLMMKRPALWERIRERTGQIYAAGLVDEVEGLLARHGRFSMTARAGIGYAEALSVLGGERSRDEAMERTFIRTRQLAKRQLTWFRQQHDVRWVDATDRPTMDVVDEVEAHWERDGPAEVCLS